MAMVRALTLSAHSQRAAVRSGNVSRALARLRSLRITMWQSGSTATAHATWQQPRACVSSEGAPLRRQGQGLPCQAEQAQGLEGLRAYAGSTQAGPRRTPARPQSMQ